MHRRWSRQCSKVILYFKIVFNELFVLYHNLKFMYLGKIHRSLGKENINNFEPLDYDVEKEKIPTF